MSNEEVKNTVKNEEEVKNSEVTEESEKTLEVTVTEKPSKKVIAKAFLKKNWKKIAGGAGLVALGALAASKLGHKADMDDESDDGDYIEGDYEEVNDYDEAEASSDDSKESEEVESKD